MEANIETDNGVAKSIYGACCKKWQAGYYQGLRSRGFSVSKVEILNFPTERNFEYP